MSIPPLGVGMGIYLPSQITLMIATGAVIGWFFNRRAARHAARPEDRKQLGVLMATGLIVGESILGVIIAAIVVFSGKEAPLGLVGDGFANWAAVRSEERRVGKEGGARGGVGT